MYKCITIVLYNSTIRRVRIDAGIIGIRAQLNYLSIFNIIFMRDFRFRRPSRTIVKT